MKKLSLIAIIGSLFLIIGCGNSPKPNYNIPPGIDKPDISDKVDQNSPKYNIPSGIKKPNVVSKVSNTKNRYSKIPIHKHLIDKGI